MRTLGVVATLVLVASGLAGCGDDSEDPDGAATSVAPVPVVSPTFDVEGPAYAVGVQVHLGAGTLDLEQAPDSFVVTAFGLYYTASGTLYVTDGERTEQVADLGTAFLATSENGRLLAYLDARHGPEDEFGTSAQVAVVVDLEREGAEVLRTDPGSLADEDLEVLYGESPPALLGFSDGSLLVDDPLLGPDLTQITLDDGSPEPLPSNDTGVVVAPAVFTERGTAVTGARTRAGTLRLARTSDTESTPLLLSPDQRFAFDAAVAAPRFFQSDTGAPTAFDLGAPDLPRFQLGGWLDATRFYGVATDRKVAESGGRNRPVECNVTSRRCSPLGPAFDTAPMKGVLFADGRERGVF